MLLKAYMIRKFVLTICCVLCCVVCLVSCVSDKVGNSSATLKMHYASLLSIEEADSFTIVKVADPWHKQRTMASYVLVPKSQSLPLNMPHGEVVRTPIERSTLTSAVHMSLMLDLGTEQYIAGVTDTAYVISTKIKNYLRLHKDIKNMGTSMSPNLELMKYVQCDAVFVSPFENADYSAFNKSKLTLVQCADYMETSPLGRAEWMRFYGRLFGKAASADSLFDSVEKNYLLLKDMVKKGRDKCPSVMCDLRTGNIWYQPGGKSTMGQFINDAGARYLWADNKDSGSLPLGIENVLMRGSKADIWLVKYGQSDNLTYKQMQQDYLPYTQVKAWKKHRIWACNTMKTAFYEEVPFHPERLLKNLIHIFHPDVVSSSDDYYIPMK